MNKEERTKTLINNIKLNINKQNVYEFGLCVEQWKQILDYIEQLQQENKKYKEVINKAIEYLRSNYIEVLKYDDIPSETTSYEIVTVDLLKILKGVE